MMNHEHQTTKSIQNLLANEENCIQQYFRRSSNNDQLQALLLNINEYFKINVTKLFRHQRFKIT